MLAMGATLEPKDLRQVLRTKKRGVVAGWCSQSGPWAAPERVNVTRVDSILECGAAFCRRAQQFKPV